MFSIFLLVVFLVWQVTATTTFIEKGKRAEIFELTDNEVPVFRLTLPEDQFKVVIENLQSEKMSFSQVMNFDFNDLNSTDPDAKGNDLFATETNDIKIKEGTLVVELNGQKKTFKKITFSAGGSSARTYGRQGFNLKIRGKDKLFGRSQFRIRSDARDATTMRSKLACDIHNRLGLVSISANYMQLYINDEYLGFYILMDSPKLPWIEEIYGEKDTPNLYKCKAGGHFLSEETCAVRCENENDDITDKTEWIKFLRALDNAKTPEDIEKVLEVDQFLYEVAYEYLSGAWDHLIRSGHNYSLYKQKSNGKWIIYYYDFDADFGQDIVSIEFGQFNPNPDKNFPNYTYQQWFNVPMNVLNILIFNDPTRFENIIRKIVTDTFNPATLFPHIDEIKKFIQPYIKQIKTPKEDGTLPGVLNKLNPVDYSYAEWDANSEFTTINNEPINGSAYGLKYWILARYRAVCKHLSIECDPIYMNEDYEYPIDKNVEGEINLNLFDGIDFEKVFGGMNNNFQVPSNSTTVVDPEPAQTTIISEPAQTTTISEPTQKYKCWAELAGYPCCSERIKIVYEHDEFGDWGYDYSIKQWCGLTPYSEKIHDEICWSEVFGYPCCESCYVFETDDYGKWGYENNHWCGIQSYCSA
ncbi:hypothetical protein BCR32DRAFT_274749 [Anaeromyces robustus]|uniref:CBM10 domain-containing protein n=1 Tax=Anaeromyces robustus TaxID=1754192 RepID=A0A1Y1XN03_9FUNG|nr:hypothetical protein BCR32DRAFT_274749 [Anaeromyces robustus]|eukprot:ORX87118.1 hypothetical protein BCR32DRAFT_274749 [Anaeromyces robustus]